MNIEELRNFRLSLKSVEEPMPFDDKTFIFPVKKKMFCAIDINIYKFVNLKCNPDKAIQLRKQYNEVIEGYYVNKKHWNSIKTKGKITDKQSQEWIEDSYDLVVLALPKKIQKEPDDE